MKSSISYWVWRTERLLSATAGLSSCSISDGRAWAAKPLLILFAKTGRGPKRTLELRSIAVEGLAPARL
jgi:hypothetical protein